MKNDNLNETKFLKLKAVLALIPLSKTTIYDSMAEGKFPRQIKIGPKSVAWDHLELQAWMKERADVYRVTT